MLSDLQSNGLILFKVWISCGGLKFNVIWKANIIEVRFRETLPSSTVQLNFEDAVTLQTAYIVILDKQTN